MADPGPLARRPTSSTGGSSRGAYAGAVERAEPRAPLLRRAHRRVRARRWSATGAARALYNAEFSAGVENVGCDSQPGFNSAIFVRTAKLKDFPWNGWLTLGVAGAPTAAWNPVAGFTDPTGRLIWWAASAIRRCFPAPSGRLRAGSAIPPRWRCERTGDRDPEGRAAPGARHRGRCSRSGKGQDRAGGAITYRVRASAFHDDTRMTPDDALYALRLRRPLERAGPGHVENDPAIEAATETARQALVGFRVVRSVRHRGAQLQRGDVHLVVTHAVEVYWTPRARRPEPDRRGVAPWSAGALARARADGGSGRAGRCGAFSAGRPGAAGVRWLDLARDAKTARSLARDRSTALAQAELRSAGPRSARDGRRGEGPLGRAQALRADAAATSW